MEKYKLNANQKWIVETLVDAFYSCVPTHYKTHCSLTSRISSRTLSSFGIQTDLVPCQLWCATPTHNYVIGFVGDTTPDRWDGHVICVAGDYLIDAATHHVRQQFNVSAPDILLSEIIPVPTQVISRYNLDETRRLWWHPSPVGIDATPPAEPQEMIDKYSDLLIRKIQDRLDRREVDVEFFGIPCFA